MFFHIYIIIICITSVFGNFYEILGVSKSATDFDIKKSYKKLARQWHPDKNRSPEANDQFTKINEAYEVLSNTDKRKEYDAFGSVSNEPRNNDRQQGHFWTRGNFGNAYFDFGQNEQSESNFESTNYRHYKIEILPNSFKQPSLILLVSHFCFSCHHAIRVWGNIVTQLTEAGIRVTLADVMSDSHLREELRIQHVPTVVMVIDGEVKYMQSEISKETVTDFIRYSFPRNLIQHIQTEDDLNYFHNSWSSDSRAKMIMTKPLDRPSFRYLSIAFKYRNKISAAFLNIADGGDDSDRIIEAYDLKINEESVIVFHDEKRYYPNNIFLPKPVGKKSQTRLSLSDIDSLVQSNYELPFPRLLSQVIFDLACPPPSQKQRLFGFCVITVVHSKHKSNLSQSESWQYVRSIIGDRAHGKMLYMFGDVQYKFLQSLNLIDPGKSSVDAFMDQVILLWRQSYTGATSLILSNPWQYSNIDMVLQNWDVLSNFDKAVYILKTRNQLQDKIIDSESLSELVDELAAPLWTKIGYRLQSYAIQIYLYSYEFLSEPFNLIIIVLGFALASYVYSTIKAVSTHLSEESAERSTAPTNRSQSPQSQQKPRPPLPWLTTESYQALISSAQPGRLLCLVLSTPETPAAALHLVRDSIARLNDGRLLALAMPAHRHQAWLRTLLASIPLDDDRGSALASVSRLSGNRPVAHEGIVLALHVGRRYLSICPVNLLSSLPSSMPTSFDLDSSDSDGETVSGNQGDRFFDWLCQLTEGACRRYHVTSWPPLL